MEVSLQVRDAAECRATLAEAFAWERSAKLRPYLDSIAPRLTHLPVSRIASGTEFCEHLIPHSIRAIRDACDKPFTLLTPYVGDRGLEKLRCLFAELRDGDEVVFNDWGVLNLLRREFPGLVPVQGRLMTKSLRDPRVMGIYGDSSTPAGASANATLRVLQGSNLDNAAYTAMLGNIGVALAEIDGLPQGNALESALALAAYLPFGFVATARVCQAAGLGYAKTEKFQPASPCRHECQTFLAEHTYTNSPFENRDQVFWLKGNTYFFTHPAHLIDSLLEAARAGRIHRLNIQPRVPMLEVS
ncbi:MAG: hypothetical protein SFV18_10740 [Bryobacteraceae bacterium]|nr:hypothetical protein [Bryobacteraceae bacterium]